jgi:2-octaprenyl-6-methoxyphenol hydroxylase
MSAGRVDVAILGAGPVGCALALALAREGRSVGLVERRPAGGAAQPAFRPIALSYASRLILERLGAWRSIDATPIDRVHVSQAGAFGCSLLSADDAGVPALGYVADYEALARALAGEVAARGIALTQGARIDSIAIADDRARLALTGEGAPRELHARCVVHAEGAAPDAKEKRYGFDALVGLVRIDRRADARAPRGTAPRPDGPRRTAFERFTHEGPLALLPAGEHYGLVWSARPERAAKLAAMASDEFVAELQRAAGSCAGRFVSVEARASFPLALRWRAARIAARQVFVGNAAQTLHPVAGQGLNLGLRDVWDLAEAWRDAPDPGSAGLLQAYSRSRRLDAAAAIRVTDFLAGAFRSDAPFVGALRGVALSALDVVPPARRFFARRMIFGASAIP